MNFNLTLSPCVYCPVLGSSGKSVGDAEDPALRGPRKYFSQFQQSGCSRCLYSYRFPVNTGLLNKLFTINILFLLAHVLCRGSQKLFIIYFVHEIVPSKHCKLRRIAILSAFVKLYYKQRTVNNYI